jgi:hypothetical protein
MGSNHKETCMQVGGGSWACLGVIVVSFRIDLMSCEYETRSVGDGSHSWIAAGAEPDAHQFMSRFVYERGDRMEVNSDDIVSTPKLGQACMGK